MTGEEEIDKLSHSKTPRWVTCSKRISRPTFKNGRIKTKKKKTWMRMKKRRSKIRTQSLTILSTQNFSAIMVKRQTKFSTSSSLDFSLTQMKTS